MVYLDQQAIKVYVKIHRAGREVILAACDSELLGITIRDLNRGINLYIDPSFYKGELVDINELPGFLAEATSASLIGKNAVEAAIEAGLVHREAIIDINGVLIAFYVRM